MLLTRFNPNEAILIRGGGRSRICGGLACVAGEWKKLAITLNRAAHANPPHNPPHDS